MFSVHLKAKLSDLKQFHWIIMSKSHNTYRASSVRGR